MSENITELNLLQLRRALQQAALPAERQMKRLQGFDVPFEVADDVYNQTLWVLQSPDVTLTDEQRSNLVELDELTQRMSGKHNAELWTEDAIRSRPEWDEVRQRARKILELFQWPMEDEDDPGVVVVRPRSAMKQSLGLVSLVVRNYDEAIAFFVGKLAFDLVEDTFIPDQFKRWVVVSPPGATESRLLLAQATSAEQASRVGTQAGGRVFLFLYTDDLWRDYERYRDRGIEFVRAPKQEPYGIVAVFKDLYGNLWDLLQPTESLRIF